MSQKEAGQSRLEVSARRGKEAYRTAARHGRLVRLLRFLLPLAVLAGAGAFGASLYFTPQSPGAVSIAKIDLTSNSLVMEAPRVSGFTNTRRSYEVSAQKATQNLQNPKVVRLEGIDATLGLDGAGKATIGAAIGLYDSEAETLRLSDGIHIETPGGYQATLQEADVNLRTSTMKSTQKVEIRLTDGVIRGNGVEISEGGKRIQFSNGVSMTFGSNPTGISANPTEGIARKSP